MTRRRLLASIDAWELAHWRAMWNVDGPFLLQRLDGLFARLSALEATLKTGAPQCPVDYLPNWAREQCEEPIQSEDEMRAEVRAFQEARRQAGL